MKNISILCFLALIPTHAFSIAHVAPEKTEAFILPKGSWSVRVDGAQETTTSHFNVNGEEVSLVGNESYSRLDGDVEVSYGYNPKFEFTLGGRYRQLVSNDGTQEVTASGFESAVIRGRYLVAKEEKYRAVLEAAFRQAMYSPTMYDQGQIAPATEVELGDGENEKHLGIYLTYKKSPSFMLTGFLGYNVPASHLSHELLYKAYGSFIGKRFGLRVGIEGIRSMQTDDYTDNPAARPTMGTGETYRVNSLNREYMLPFARVSASYKNIRFGASYAQSMGEASYDKFTRIGAFLEWTNEETTSRSDRIHTFKEYVVEGEVIKVSPRGTFIKIDQGLSDAVVKGMRVDIFQSNVFGTNILVATGYIYEVRGKWSIVKLTKKFSEMKIKTGFSARGYDK